MSWITLGAIFLMVGMTGSISAGLALSDLQHKQKFRFLILITQILYLALVIAGGTFIMKGVLLSS
jgi:hypothetical protein